MPRRSSRAPRELEPQRTLKTVGIAVLLVIIGIVLLLLGVFVEAVKFLLWIGLVILIIGIIAALMRFIRRQA